MATDYGKDVRCLDDVDDPEVMVSGDQNLAYALARRWLTPTGALDEIGDTALYDSIDVREWFGARFSLTDRTVIDDLQTQAQQVLLGDPRVDSATVTVTFAQGTLTMAATCIGTNGPFSLVLAVDGVSAQLLRQGG